MSRRRNREALSQELSTQREAFLHVLLAHQDHIVSAADLEEYHPDVDWTGKISASWKVLKMDESIAPHLKEYGDGKTRVYSYLSDPTDDTLLLERLADMARELEEPSEFFQIVENKESLAVREETIHRWWKVAVVAGVAVTAMTVTGRIIYDKMRKN